MKSFKGNQGFTLVEIAIVMVIIGLLTGGILKGQELIRSAKVNKTIATVKSYFAAGYSFQNKYGFFPGDHPNAKTVLPGCEAATCYRGDGDGVIGIRLTYANYATIQMGLASIPSVETSMFWKHLTMADMITGIDPSADPISPEAGRTHPTSPFGGLFDVATIVPNLGTRDVGYGINFRLQGGVGGPTAANAFLSPAIAYEIDMKMDDGDPDRGVVNADLGGTNCDDGGVYQVTGDGRCVMFFSFSN